jgi:hypothetical protein
MYYKENQTLLVAIKEVCPDINAKNMLSSCEQNKGQNCNTKIGKKSFTGVAMFRCLGMTLMNQTCMHEEIKSRWNSVTACYHSFVFLLVTSKYKD